MTMQEMERAAIEAALREANGNRRRAAEMLGIGERTLYRKLKEYGTLV
jgi:DNA-binding NtrC family response regulator